MILTNALLSITFSIIADFTNVVSIPENGVPKGVADLVRFTVGTPHSPIDVGMEHHQGTEFFISEGIVMRFTAPGSFMELQNPALVPPLLGEPTMSSNEVLELATRTIERLARTTNPIANIKPLVKCGRKMGGQVIPFYEITWPKPYYRPGFGYFAGIEIDARKRQITHLELHDPSFYDYALARQISNQVCFPEPSEVDRFPKSHAVEPPTYHTVLGSSPRHYPLPATNQVEEAILRWLWLCQQFNLNSGGNPTLATVNWDGTWLMLDDTVGPSNDVPCRVEFADGTWLAALKGTALSHHAHDICWYGYWERRTREQWLYFKGRINKHWQDLASDLDRVLVDKLGVPKKILDRYTPRVEFGPSDSFGTETMRRVLVLWKDRTNFYNSGYGAEFDLETGEINSIAFSDPAVIEALRKAQSK